MGPAVAPVLRQPRGQLPIAGAWTPGCTILYGSLVYTVFGRVLNAKRKTGIGAAGATGLLCVIERAVGFRQRPAVRPIMGGSVTRPSTPLDPGPTSSVGSTPAGDTSVVDQRRRGRWRNALLGCSGARRAALFGGCWEAGPPEAARDGRGVRDDDLALDGDGGVGTAAGC